MWPLRRLAGACGRFLALSAVVASAVFLTAARALCEVLKCQPGELLSYEP
jgi:Cro/C1-type helix-turn-helix DNA-binding protein